MARGISLYASIRITSFLLLTVLLKALVLHLLTPARLVLKVIVKGTCHSGKQHYIPSGILSFTVCEEILNFPHSVLHSSADKPLVSNTRQRTHSR